MTQRIPNLWKMKLKADDREPGTLYALYLCGLMLKDQDDRVIEACRVIRRYALKGPGIKEAFFTFSQEYHSLITLGRLEEALRQVRRRDRIVYGHSDYSRLVWKEDSGTWPIICVAPLHYWLGRYELGCHILEAALEPWFNNDWKSSYYWFTQIAHQPRRHKARAFYPVSLAMFYHQLGKDLHDWKQWNAFIDGFPEKFFTVLKIGKEELRSDSKLLPKVISRIGEMQKKNRPYYTSGGGGQSMEDIIESSRQIKRRHDLLLKENRQTQEEKRERAKVRRKLDQRLAELFPELQD